MEGSPVREFFILINSIHSNTFTEKPFLTPMNEKKNVLCRHHHDCGLLLLN
jgi:hypothetical protein